MFLFCLGGQIILCMTLELLYDSRVIVLARRQSAAQLFTSCGALRETKRRHSSRRP